MLYSKEVEVILALDGIPGLFRWKLGYPKCDYMTCDQKASLEVIIRRGDSYFLLVCQKHKDYYLKAGKVWYTYL